MSCTHDCGCTPEIRDARTDEWVQIAPESARPATLTPEQPVKAPGQGGDIFLTRGKPVEVEWPTRAAINSSPGGWTGKASSATLPWREARIVRVLTTEDKPTQEPVLPRRIKPEDVRVGMVVERRHGDMAHRDRVQQIDGGLIDGTVAYLWKPGHEEGGWTLWLVEDAPEPVDPDAAVIEAIITAYRRSPECSTDSVFGEAMLDHLRAQGFDVTPRAEQ
jgi:hypothetical protein